MKQYSYFTEDEIRCKCGCGLILVDRPHFFSMNLLRSAMGQPLTVTSWCRCPDHNHAEGGKADSSHIPGFATDVFCPTHFFMQKLIFYAGRIGFCGIGMGIDFLHLDSDLRKGFNRFWTY